jgi:hypothetical protein
MSSNQLTLTDILEHIRYARESQRVLAALEDETLHNLKCTSFHAVYLIQSLFSDTSSDQANIRRITMNLEAAADDLILFSKLIKTLLQINETV